jgi:hypothetical protein
MSESLLKRQVIPLSLTFLVCAVLIFLLWGEIHVLNHFTTTDILLSVRWYDVLVGFTIYIKTSIDFAIFIGRLMSRHDSWKSRIAIEVGTAIGNAAGTMIILLIWCFFKEIRWLLALMVLVAALVLFKLAEDSLEHVLEDGVGFPQVRRMAQWMKRWLGRGNKMVAPVLKYLLPHMEADNKPYPSLRALFLASLTIPFILGLDDFAGYVPLFSVVNVFGFSIGVFAGHMILNLLLYISPERTIRVVKNSIISLLGGIAFIGLGIWGLFEVIHLIGV